MSSDAWWSLSFRFKSGFSARVCRRPPHISESLTLALRSIIFTLLSVTFRAAKYWLTAAVTFSWHVCVCVVVFFKCRRSRSSWPLWEGPYRRPVWPQPTAGWHHHRERTGQPRLLLSSSSSADSAFLLCIRRISDMSSGFSCVSAWSRKTCDLFGLIYIHIKQYIHFFPPHCVILGCSSGRQWAAGVLIFFWNVLVSGWSSTGVKTLLKGISLSSVSIKPYSVFQQHRQ